MEQWLNETNESEGCDTRAWKSEEAGELTMRSNPDVSQLETPKAHVIRAASADMHGVQAQPLVETLEENKTLKNEITRQRFEIFRLKDAIYRITGKDSAQIATEISELSKEKEEWLKLKSELEAESERLRAEFECLQEENRSLTAAQIEHVEENQELHKQLDALQSQINSARARYPDFDETVDHVLGTAQDRKMGDLVENIKFLELQNDDLQKKLDAALKSSVKDNTTFHLDTTDSLRAEVLNMQSMLQERDDLVKRLVHSIAILEKQEHEAKVKLEKFKKDASIVSLNDTSIIGLDTEDPNFVENCVAKLKALRAENQELQSLLETHGANFDITKQNIGDVTNILQIAETAGKDNAGNEYAAYLSQLSFLNELSKEFCENSALNLQKPSAPADITECQDRISALKDMCKVLFARLKGSSELFAEILHRLAHDDNSDLVARIRELQLTFDESQQRWNETQHAIEDAESSIANVTWALQNSIQEESIMENASVLSPLRQREPLKLAASSPLLNTTRFVKREQLEEEQIKLKHMQEELQKLQEEYENMKSLVEQSSDAQKLREDLKIEHEQLETAKHDFELIQNELSVAHKELATVRDDLQRANLQVKQLQEKLQLNLLDSEKLITRIESLEEMNMQKDDELKKIADELEQNVTYNEKLAAEVVQTQKHAAIEVNAAKELAQEISAKFEYERKRFAKLQIESQEAEDRAVKIEQEMEALSKQHLDSQETEKRALAQLEQAQELAHELRVKLARILKAQGETTTDDTETDDLLSQKLKSLLGISSRICEKFTEQERFIRENNCQVARIYEQLVPTHSAPKLDTAQVQKSASTSMDPLRSAFRDYASQANDMVQVLKNCTPYELRERMEQLLEMSRALRQSLSEKYTSLGSVKSGEWMEDAVGLAQRIAILMQDKRTLEKELQRKQALLDDIVNSSSGGAKLDPLLCSKIRAELDKNTTALKQSKHFMRKPLKEANMDE